MQTTLALVKPVAVSNRHAPAILDEALHACLSIDTVQRLELTRATAEAFYAEHAGRPYFESIVSNLCSGPVVVAILSGDDAIARWRRLLGPADPKAAPPFTIRHVYGTVLPDNAAHGSDSPEAARREIALLLNEHPINAHAASVLNQIAMLCSALGLHHTAWSALTPLRHELLGDLTGDSVRRRASDLLEFLNHRYSLPGSFTRVQHAIAELRGEPLPPPTP